MSASHARVACGAEGDHAFARVYAHSGMVAYQGAKMSKSLGNLVFVSRLRAAGVDPMAVRLALLAHHYRSDWEWTDAVLAAAQARLERWRAAVARRAAAMASGAPAAQAVLAMVRERLADDLDAPGAVAAVDAWADAVLAGPGSAAPDDTGLVSDTGLVRGTGPVSDTGLVSDAELVRDTVDALLGVAL
jgi:L-cysteine:1D-myo-inositol 2-amino-2-deoxy-alpha-D-glucopyranoside ligase